MPTQVSFAELMVDKIVEQLSAYLILSTGDKEKDYDEASAGLVRAGKLQDDPTIRVVNILVTHATEDFPNKIYSPSEMPGHDFEYTYSIGADLMSLWVQRFSVKFNMIWNGEYSRQVAEAKAQTVLGRAEHATMLLNHRLHEIPMDSFGKKPSSVALRKSWLREGAGEGSFRWTGVLEIEVLCSFEPR
jgi:hypothetical protein